MSTASLVMWSVISAAAGLGYALQLFRWVRVLQRENYQPRAVQHFFGRWASPASASATAVKHGNNLSTRLLSAPFSATTRALDNRRGAADTYRADPGARKTPKPISFPMVMITIIALAIATRADPVALVLAIVYALLFPWGMPLRSRSLPLKWDARVVVVLVVSVFWSAVFGLVLLVWWHPLDIVALELMVVPAAVELAARSTFVLSRAGSHADVATAALARHDTAVVAIAGSAGTSELARRVAELVGRPDSYMTAPTVIHDLHEFAIAVAGELPAWTRTYAATLECRRPDEWRELTDRLSPSLVVVHSLGPVHLEQFGSIEAVDAALFALAQRATSVVVNVDDTKLARWPDRLRAPGVRVRRAGSGPNSDVAVTRAGDRWLVAIDGDGVAEIPARTDQTTSELACAVAAGLDLGVTRSVLAERLQTLTTIPGRAVVSKVPSGLTVMADTVDVNPLTARRTLETFRALPCDGRRVVVTPGFVELGSSQGSENYKLAALIEQTGAELVAVARTNAEALLDGTSKKVRRYDTRKLAVRWVRATLGAGDVVLYLNDLPDHYP